VMIAGCKKTSSDDESKEPGTAKTGTALKSKGKQPLDAPPECRKLCRIVGKCTLKDGKCIATSSESCRACAGCKTGGLCEARDGKCIAATNAHCEQCDLCKSEGRCIAVNGRCENSAVPPEPSAAASGSAK